MSGPTNRRFVRSAWTLVAFQFVAAGGATALAIWAATKVQGLVDQRDLLQARVAQLETEQRRQAVAPVEEIPQTQMVPAMPAQVTLVPEPAPKAAPQPTRAPPPRGGNPGVTVHTAPPPTVVIETPPPPREPVTYVPPREPPPGYVPPRRPPVIVRPTFPTRPVPTPQQPNPRPVRPNNGAPPAQQPTPGIVRPIRPGSVTIHRPPPTEPQAGTSRPATNQQADPRRIRRPRPADTEPQPTPPK